MRQKEQQPLNLQAKSQNYENARTEIKTLLGEWYQIRIPFFCPRQLQATTLNALTADELQELKNEVAALSGNFLRHSKISGSLFVVSLLGLLVYSALTKFANVEVDNRINGPLIAVALTALVYGMLKSQPTYNICRGVERKIQAEIDSRSGGLEISSSYQQEGSAP